MLIQGVIKDRCKPLGPRLKDAVKKWGAKMGTVQKRLQGRLPPGTKHTKNHKLEKLHEESLCRWILQRDEEGYPCRKIEVEEMAKEFLAAHHVEGTIGKEWVNMLAERNEPLTAHDMKGYICKSGSVESAEVISDWFQDFRGKVEHYNIAIDRIYKMDISGIQIGRIGRVVDSMIVNNPEEWVSIIECINARGDALDPFIIFKRKSRFPLLTKYVPRGWLVDSGSPEWDYGMVVCEWLRRHFIPLTSPIDTEEVRMLLIDGHRSQRCEIIERICKENNIITLHTPKHSSHLFYSLNVSSFPPLKQFYHSRIRKGLSVVKQCDRVELLKQYATARAGTTIGRLKIKKCFKESGLVPFNIELVVKKVMDFPQSGTGISGELLCLENGL